MSSKDNDKKLLPQVTQSSYERVLEWNNQAEQEANHMAFRRRPGSVSSGEHPPQGLSSLRDDMALTDLNDPFDFNGHEQWIQHQASFVDEVNE